MQCVKKLRIYLVFPKKNGKICGAGDSNTDSMLKIIVRLIQGFMRDALQQMVARNVAALRCHTALSPACCTTLRQRSAAGCKQVAGQ